MKFRYAAHRLKLAFYPLVKLPQKKLSIFGPKKEPKKVLSSAVLTTQLVYSAGVVSSYVELHAHVTPYKIICPLVNADGKYLPPVYPYTDMMLYIIGLFSSSYTRFIKKTL